MDKKKKHVRGSWAGQYANESAHLKYLSDLDAQTAGIRDEITLSDERTKQLIEDIDRAREERKHYGEDPDGYSHDFTLAPIDASLGDFQQNINAAAEDYRNENLPKQSNYTKNWWNHHGRKMNQFQIDDFQGYIDRTTHWQQLSQGVMRSWDIEEQVNDINRQIEELRSQPYSPQGESQIANLLGRQEQLMKEHLELKPVRDAFDSYIPSGIKSRWYDLVAGNADDGSIFNIFSNNPIFGRTSQMHDEMGDFLRFTAAMYTKGVTRERQREIMKAALDTSNKKIQEWQSAIQQNIKDQESYGKVDDWYQRKADAAGTDIFNSDTWAYGMSGLIAGSTSGASKILPSMLLGIATASAVAATGGIAALGIGAAGFAGTAGLNYGAGVAENNAEVANAYKERIEPYLKGEKGQTGTLYDDLIKEGRKKLGGANMTDQQIFDAFRRVEFTSNNAALNKELNKLAIGIENQFQDDMYATTYGALFESALQVLPVGRLIPSRLIKYSILKNAAGRKAVRASEKIINNAEKVAANMAEGFVVGSAVSPFVGALYAPLHTLVRPVANKIGRLGKSAVNNIAKATKISNYIPESTFTTKFLSEPRKRFIKDISGRWILSSIQEGVEEGVQHISAEKYKSGEYTSDVIKSHAESILDNVLAGSKSAGLLFGMPLEGLMSESDREILKEIKGGFLLGGLQTAMVNTSSSYFPYRSEVNAREAVAEAVLADKAKKMDDFKKGILYAEASKSGSSYRHIMDAFDLLTKENEKEKNVSGEYGVDPTAIEQEIERFKNVAKVANDAYTRKQAEAQGIKIGSDEYNRFVSAKVIAEDQLKEEESVLKDARETHQQNVENLANDILTKRMNAISSIIPGSEQEESSQPESNDAVIQEDVSNYARTQFVAQYSAMLRRKIDLELGIENAKAANKERTVKILQQQLDNLNKRIELNKPIVRKYIKNDVLNLDSLEEFEQEAVLDKTWHDTLSDSYGQLLLAEDDYTLAKDTYKDLVGHAYVDGKPYEDVEDFDATRDFDKVEFKNGKAKKVVKEIHDTIQDDNDFVSTIAEDYDQRTDDDENEIVTPEEKEEIQEAAPDNNPEEEFKEEVIKASKKPYVQPVTTVREKPVEAISSPSEPVSTAQPTVVPEEQQTPLEKPKNEKDESVKRAILETFDQNEVARFERTRLLSLVEQNQIPEADISYEDAITVYDAIRDFVVDEERMPMQNPEDTKNIAERAFGKPTVENITKVLNFSSLVSQTDFLQQTYDLLSYIKDYRDQQKYGNKTQKKVLEELKRRAELSKSRVKKITSEYYLIQVGDELIQMPRVHSIMPKYWYKEGGYAAALQLGNAFDNLARIFFGNPNYIEMYETDPEQVVLEMLYDLPVSEDQDNPNSLNLTYSQLYESKEAFDKTIKDLYELAKQYRDLGWVLSTDKIVWYSQFESGWVAGETDMLAVDRDGNIHIIDFKTAKGLHPFETYLNDDVYRTNKYAEQLATLTEKDFKAGPNKKALSKTARAVKRAIRQAEGDDKNIMLDWHNGRAVLRYADSDFTNPNKLSGLRKGSKQQEYSDQLTAYAEMIQKQLANVVDLEVIGFKTQYDTDAQNNLVSVKYLDNQVNGKPFRIKLPFSDNMRSILNNEGAPADLVENPNSDAVEAKQEAEAIEQTQNAETVSNDKFVPNKSEDSLHSPNEPVVQSKESLKYFNINQQAVERDPDLAKLVASPDFINECLQNGLVTLYTEEVTERGKKNRYLYADINYGGKTYKRLYIWDNGTLQKKVEELEKNANGKRIVATAMKRTAGKIQARKDGKSVPVTDTSLLAGQKLEDLEFTIEDGRFGIVRKGNVVSFAGGDVTQPRDMYTNLHGVPEGTLVFVKNPNHKENPNERIPVTVARKTFSDSADFIIETLQQFSTIDQPYLITIDGKQKNLGVTRKQLMSLLMPMVKDVDQASGYSIMRNAAHPSVFHVVVRTQPQPIISVDLQNPQSMQAFKQFLNTAQMPLFNSILVSRIGSDSNNTLSVFKGIKKFFGQNADVQSFSVTPDIRFDRSDILGKGLSGLGWYIKTGRLITNFEDIVAPLVSIGDADYFGEIKEQPVNKVPTINEQIETVPDDDIVDIQFGDLYKRLTEEDKNKPKLTPEKIKENLRPILGNEVDDETVLDIVTYLATDPRVKDAAVVGKAHKDGITIYSSAFEGVEYHEAFHRIFELFVPIDVRDKIYDAVGKQLGLDLSKDSKENDFAQHRIVAEHVADAYMDYKAGEFKTRFSLLNRILNKLRDWVNRLFRISDRQLYKIFLEVNSGKYRSERRGKASEAQKKRLKDMFGELNYEVHGAEFVHIMNDPMYEDVKNTTFYCMMLGQDIDLSGKNVSKTKINRDVFMRGAERLKDEGYDIFGTDVEPDMKSPGQLAMSEMYINLDKVSDDIAAMFASISTDYKKLKREEKEEDLDGDEISIASAWDENFFKWDYEFSRFDKSTSRVKYFFSSIPDMEYDEDMNFILSRNSLGMPQMLPMKYVFNETLSHLWDIDTLDELTQRLAKLSSQNPMWKIINDRVLDLLKRRTDSKGKPDADVEALLTQLMNTIRSNRHTFMLAKAVENAEGLYTISMQTSDADYNAREYPIQWSQILAKGGSEVLKVNKDGQLVFNPKNPEAAIAFKKIAVLFDTKRESKDGSILYVGLKQMLSDTPTEKPKQMLIWDIFGTEPYEFAEYSGINLENSLANRKIVRNYTTSKITDLNDPKQLAKVKEAICEALSAIGINMHVQEFDYMLSHKYGSTDADALRMMINSTDQSDSIGSFLFFLNTISNGKKLNIDNEGRVRLQNGKAVPLESVYENLAFVKELGNWKYQYRHSHDELTVLATGNNRFYEMSDNDLFSDTLRALNKRTQWYEDLKQDPYNYYTSSEPDANGEYRSYGSYTLDQLTKNPELKLQLKHLIGFKTDKQNDTGQDYFEISRREDYLSKVGILESGGILSLTLSDKKKYVWISGIKLPGLDYTDILDSEGNILPNAQNAIQKTHSERDGGIDQLDSVVSQFLSYAMSEYESIKRLANKDINVVNFKEQGKRFSSLLGVWEDKYDKNGDYVGEEFISFNNRNKRWEDNLRTAETYFFNRTEDEQKALIKRNLNKILDKELKTAETLGLIQKVGTNENSYLNYKNVGLNDIAIKSIANAYMQKYPGISQDIAESIAVVVYLNDISAKAIMSGQEMERLISGNPAFYKWKYNNKGQLIDRTVDELKRLGGTGSTGTNNFTELVGIPEKYVNGKYTCAEVDNELIASPQFEFLKDRMYQGELRQNVIRNKIEEERAFLQTQMDMQIEQVRKDNLLEESDKQLIILDIQKQFRESLQAARDRITDDVDNTSIGELETEYEDSEILALSREKAKIAADSYAGKIDVADGGAYITDEMCEMLLRMEGSWGKEIEEAFDILRGKIKADYLGQADAYQKVLTSVIGNQKYTAFGRRLQNGVSIPYYHKMALFPIFECIATGKMSNIFDKMKKQGIDMLLVNSAVKVGSEGSKSIDWSDFRENDDEQNENNFFEDNENGTSWKPTFEEAFDFNTYEVDFSYLRKQLNTDPKEDEMLRMGTQAQKIIFSNLFRGRLYNTQSGEQIKGDALQTRIMDSMNELSNLGVKKLNKRFFVTDKEGNLLDADGNIITDQNSNDRQIDIEKFAKEVSKLMSDRGADKNVLKALEVITQGDNKTTAIPLGAISNASWLESVLISMINKDVVDVNTPGAFFIQRSVWAMQGQRMYSKDKGNIIGRQLYNGKRLEMMNEEGSMDCVLSIDYFSHILPKVKSDEYELDENGDYTYVVGKDGKYKTDQYSNYIAKRKMRDMTFNEARQWLLDNGIIGGKANIIAYRIPTQAESSIHALRCVDVLPVVRDTVILPEEFTKITGSDKISMFER